MGFYNLLSVYRNHLVAKTKKSVNFANSVFCKSAANELFKPLGRYKKVCFLYQRRITGLNEYTSANEAS